MMLIRDIVHDAITKQVLSVEAEDTLRRLLSQKYDREDFQAFIALQAEFLKGCIRQESRENLEAVRGNLATPNRMDANVVGHHLSPDLSHNLSHTQSVVA